MYQRNKLVSLAVLALLLSIFSLQASAQVLYSNTPWTDGGGPCIGAYGQNATGVAVQTPLDSYYFVERVMLSLHDVGDPSNFDVRLYADDSGFWGTEVGAFGILSGPGNSDYSTYTFYPNAPIILSPDTVYWVVATVSDEDASCAVGWSDDGSTPRGPFSFVAAIQASGDSHNPRDSDITLQILGGPTDAPVMAPVPGLGNWGVLLAILLLAASGGILLRRFY